MAAALPVFAWAADVNWNNANGGFYGVSTNWQINRVPTAPDTAVFNLPDAYSVDFAANATNRRLWLRDGDVTFDLGGNTYKLDLSTTFVNVTSNISTVVGDLSGNTAALTLTDGIVESVQASIGNFNSAQGAVQVDGATWNVSRTLTVGFSGTGALTIENGGSVSSWTGYIARSTGSEGEVTVAGDGSTWRITANSNVHIGSLGRGTLTIESGGQVVVDVGASNIGYFPGSQGSLVVTGAGSEWNSAVLNIGRQGSGELSIDSGGAVSNTVGYVGYEAGSQGLVNVTGAGSTWTNSESLYIGFNGLGTLRVADGGIVSAPVVYSSIDSLLGDGTVSVNGAVLDGVDLRFDGTHSVQQSIPFGAGGQLVLNLDGSGGLGAAYKATGSLSISDGITIPSASGTIGERAGSHGLATVRGAGSTWAIGGALYVGREGTGELTIQDGGNVTNTIGYVGRFEGAHGKVLVSGAGSQWTNLGAIIIGFVGGSGELTIENASHVSSVGANVRDAAIAITDEGSMWSNSSELIINGTSSLTIRNRGAVSNTAGTLGALSTAAVTGPGSNWINSGSLSIDGAMTIDEGGGVSSADSTIGHSFGDLNAAKVTVTGPGSSWDTDLLGIGYNNSDRGELIIENGASVTSRRGVIGFAAYSQGMATVTGEGSTWNVANDIELNDTTNTFPTPFRNLLKVENGARVTVGGHVEIYRLGIVAGDGGTIVGNVLNITGVVAPGVLTIDGDYTQEIGSLLIDLAGTNAGTEYDQLIVTGRAALGGRLEVSLIDEFMPSIGSSFDILDSASTSRAFTDLLLPPLASGSWDTRQLYTTGVISVIETNGDYNYDGVVDSADYVVWRKDPNRSQSQYDAWRANFGSTITIASGSEVGASVPEPASLLLYLAALATCALIHASRREKADAAL